MPVTIGLEANGIDRGVDFEYPVTESINSGMEAS